LRGTEPGPLRRIAFWSTLPCVCHPTGWDGTSETDVLSHTLKDNDGGKLRVRFERELD
jgi:hypothetical protein